MANVGIDKNTLELHRIFANTRPNELVQPLPELIDVLRRLFRHSPLPWAQPSILCIPHEMPHKLLASRTDDRELFELLYMPLTSLIESEAA